MIHFFRNKILLISSIIIISSNHSNAGEIDIEFLIEKFISSFSLFCNSLNDDVRDKCEVDLLDEIFDPINVSLIEYDLYNSKYIHTSFTANDYFAEIRNNLSSGDFHIELGNVKYISCIENYDGNQYSIVTIDKKLFLKNKSKNIKLVILINSSSAIPHISEIYSVERFNIKSTICKLDAQDIRDTINEMAQQAENYLRKNDLVEAKLIYNKSLSISGDNMKTNSRIKHIDSLITIDYLLTRVKILLQTQDYISCENAITIGLKSFPKNKELLDLFNTCIISKKNKQYNEYKEAADSYYINENFTDALSFYLLAQDVSNNNELTAKIDRCKYILSPKFIRDELGRAKNLAYNKNFVEAFLIFYKLHSPRNKVFYDGESYYIMATICAGNYGHIKNKIDLKQSELCHLTHYYTSECQIKHYRKSDFLWRIILNNRNKYCE